jgi:hypothetical protein
MTPRTRAASPKPSNVVTAALLLSSFALVGVLLEVAVFLRGVDRARRFAKAGQRFERRLSAKGATVLILGDSTGVGVGATLPEESIAGLLAADYPDADIVNVAVSGTRVAGAIAQVRTCLDAGSAVRSRAAARWRQRRRRGHAAASARCRLRQLAAGLGQLAARTVWLGPPTSGWHRCFRGPTRG